MWPFRRRDGQNILSIEWREMESVLRMVGKPGNEELTGNDRCEEKRVTGKDQIGGPLQVLPLTGPHHMLTMMIMTLFLSLHKRASPRPRTEKESQAISSVPLNPWHVI